MPICGMQYSSGLPCYNIIKQLSSEYGADTISNKNIGATWVIVMQLLS